MICLYAVEAIHKSIQKLKELFNKLKSTLVAYSPKKNIKMQNIFKNFSKTLLAAGLLFSATSCEDFLDKQPKAERAEANFYKTESDANEALTAVYDALQWHTVSGFHPLPMMMDIASDDSYAGGGSR